MRAQFHHATHFFADMGLSAFLEQQVLDGLSFRTVCDTDEHVLLTPIIGKRNYVLISNHQNVSHLDACNGQQPSSEQVFCCNSNALD